MGNYVIEVGNYVIANPSQLGNYMSADMHRKCHVAVRLGPGRMSLMPSPSRA